MCGRYEISVDQKVIEGYFDEKVPQYKGPNYNVSPTQNVPIATSEGIEVMRWGLVPQWASSLNTGYTMINAKAETLTEKRTYIKPLSYQRCLIPASGFFEWQKTDQGKVPYLFYIPDRPVFCFAGLYVIRKDSEDHELRSFTIITTTPNKLVEPIHDRMPVILSKEEEKIWLNPDFTEADQLLPLLDPYPVSEMEKHEVSTDVNSTRNNSPELIQPLK